MVNMSNEERRKYFESLSQADKDLYKMINQEIRDWYDRGVDPEDLTEDIMILLITNNYKQVR